MPKVSSKPAGKQAIKPGPSGKMVQGDTVGPQKPFVASQEGKSGAKFLQGGPSGKMQKRSSVAPQKPGRSGQR